MADDHDKHGDDGGSHKRGHGGGHGPGGGHGGEHEESGATEWLISFADNVALLMGFFVILLAMNMDKRTTGGIGGESEMGGAPDTRMVDFVFAMRKAFNNPINPDSEDPREQALIKRMRTRDVKGETKTPGPDGDDKNNQSIKTSDYFQLTGEVLFVEGDAAISPEGVETLGAIAEQKRGSRWMIEVRGHVSAAEAAQNDSRGMDLAYRRALAAVQELVNQGLKWEQLRAVACADSERRVGAARDKDAHAANQRVEIVVTQEQVAGDPYTE